MDPLFTGKLGRYRIVRRLGSGGMGSVYEAYDPNLDQRRAIKIMHLHLAEHDDLRARFLQEARAVAALDQPGIVRVFDFDEDQGYPYIVMEYISGGSLQALLHEYEQEGDWLTLFEAAYVTQQVCIALAHAHSSGILHRDIKPANILFKQRDQGTPAYQPVVTDFGLAKLAEGGVYTHTAYVMGTPHYMSPEQIQKQDLDARSDIYAVGIMLYELATTRLPMPEELSVAEIMRYHLAETFAPPSRINQAIPAALETIILKAIEKAPEQRFDNAEAMANALGAILPELSNGSAAAKNGAHKTANSRISTHFQANKPPSKPPEPPSGEETSFSEAPPTIQNNTGKALPAEAIKVLQAMFRGYKRLVIHREFGGSYGGAHVLQIEPIRRDGVAELPGIAKLGALSLIKKEWLAYTKHIRNLLPDVATVFGEPVFLPSIGWGGLRYERFGSIRKAISLSEKWASMSLDDIYKFFERLFDTMDALYAKNQRMQPAFSWRASYDRLLPMNLLLKQPPSPKATPVPEVIDARALDGSIPALSLDKQTRVQLKNFAIVKVDLVDKSVTLNVPSHIDTSAYYVRIRPKDMQAMTRFDVGHVVDVIEGEVIATRESQFEAYRFGTQHDREVRLSDDTLLPDPFYISENTSLRHIAKIRRASIHGDFNLENILVEQDGHNFRLIDFFEAREDHILHDFLRLETETITKLLPAVLSEVNRPVDVVVRDLYRELHRLSFGAPMGELPTLSTNDPLAKIKATITVIRQRARRYLADLGKPDEECYEYYNSLVIYLTGAMKFSNLDDTAREAAFWGAAATAGLMTNPPLPPPPPPKEKNASNNQDTQKPPPIRTKVIWVLAGITGVVALAVIIPYIMCWFNPGVCRGPIAEVIGIKPSAIIEEVGSENISSVQECTPLFHGDEVTTDPDASVSWMCLGQNAIMEMSGDQSVEVTCDLNPTQNITVTHLSKIITELDTCQNLAAIILDNFLGTNRSSGEEQANLPLLLSPRNSVITETRPTFAWQEVAGAERYRITVYTPDGRWGVTTDETTLPYPEAQSPLPPDSQNRVEVQVVGSESDVDETLLEVADAATQAEVEAAVTELRELGLPQQAEGYLLAQLYQERDLLDAALTELKMLLETNPDSANLNQQAGNISFEVELYTQAEDYYQAALDSAEANGDDQAQADAHIGLAQTARIFGEIETALAHLEAARSIYDAADEEDLIEKIDEQIMELSELAQLEGTAVAYNATQSTVGTASPTLSPTPLSPPTETATPLPLPTDTPTVTPLPFEPNFTPSPTSSPTLTSTPIPLPGEDETPAAQSQAGTPTATLRPTRIPTDQAPLKFDWSQEMIYRDFEFVPDVRFCEITITYRNEGDRVLERTDYQPGIGYYDRENNEDTELEGLYRAESYPNAQIAPPGATSGEPPSIPVGETLEWTWISGTDNPQQYCGIVQILLDSWRYWATYDADGQLVEEHTLNLLPDELPEAQDESDE